MRKLATIRKINAIDPIPGADAIEVATIGGWKVVIRKGEYQVGDLAIYCEIDSWIPHELAPFLTKGDTPKEYNGVKGNRLRTVKLRGQISQGLLLPSTGQTPLMGEGDDLTEFLGIQKWEPEIPAQLAGEVFGPFPSLIPKTDQERIQNITSESLEMWKDLEFEVTEKLEGSSCTMFLDMEGTFHVCSRNLDLKPSDSNSFWRAAIKYEVDRKLSMYIYYGFAIQGELVGPGIQGNIYNLKDIDFFVFDVYSVSRGGYLTPSERARFCSEMGMKHVPVLGKKFSIKNTWMTPSVLLDEAEGKSVLNPKQEREGIVFKCVTDPSIHFKCISNRYLIKAKD